MQRTLKFLLTLALVVSLPGFSPAQTTAAAATSSTNSAKPTTPAQVAAAMRDFLAQPKFAASLWGVKAVSLDTGKTFFEHNATKLLKPASNNKLYTGALALDRFGPDYHIRTSCYSAAGPDASGTLAGDLIIYGRGDFSFAARFNDGDYALSLDPLLDAIGKAGIKHIKGDLIGDDSYFRGPAYGSGWTWDDLEYYYGAEVSALTLEDNAVDLSIKPGVTEGEACVITAKPANTYLRFVNRTTTVAKGGKHAVELYRPLGENIVYVTGTLPVGGAPATESATVSKPALWFVTQLKSALAQRGITVDGTVKSADWLERDLTPVDYAKLVEVANCQSRPLSEMLEKMLKPSQNLYAQLLLLQAGAQSQSATNKAINTEDLGIAELKKFLTKAGVKNGEALIEEGSGLSRSTLLTPNASVTLLKFMHQHPQGALYEHALPIAGVDGTLRNRLKEPPAYKIVHAKTGSLRYVNSLSGYLTTVAGEKMVFSIMSNNYAAPADTARHDIDTLVQWLAGMTERTQP